jgi:hypothetical protein
MKSLHFLLYAIIFLGLLSACGSSRRTFERGNYVAATERSVREICGRSRDKTASIDILRQSYPLAMQDLNRQIQVAQNSTQPLRWEELVTLYTTANNLSNSITRCPDALTVIANPQRFDMELQNAQNQAAVVHCQLGNEKLATRRRDMGQQALQHFQKVQQYNPTLCPDLPQRIEESRLLGVLKVLVQQMPVQGYYAPSDEFFRNQINTYIVTLRKQNRLDFWFDALAIPHRMMPNYIMRFQFFDFTVGETTNRERVETVTDSVAQVDHTGGDLRLPKVAVKAELRTFEKSVRSTAILEIKITDEDNQRVLLHERFPSEFVWQSTWGNFNGDRRALNAQQLDMCNRREQTVPDRQALFTEMCRPLIEQVKPRLQQFYKDL